VTIEAIQGVDAGERPADGTGRPGDVDAKGAARRGDEGRYEASVIRGRRRPRMEAPEPDRLSQGLHGPVGRAGYALSI